MIVDIPYQAFGVSEHLGESISKGIWSQQMVQYPRIKMVQVYDHHTFLINWCQHKNKIIFQYVAFHLPDTIYWGREAGLKWINTENTSRVSLKELIYLEGKGLQFDIKDYGYIKLKLKYITELGT